MNTLWVKAGKNGPVIVPESIGRVLDPTTGLPVTVITDTPVQVPDVRHYRRRIKVGDLVLAEPPAAPAMPLPTPEGEE